jgi:hypothetical protein
MKDNDTGPSCHLENFVAASISKVRRRKIREAAAEIDRLAKDQHHALLASPPSP